MTKTGLDDTADAGTQSSPSQLTKGSTLGKYRLDRVLGEGGMGVVWAAHDPDLERAVALKLLRYAEASIQLRQRLLREARAMAKLKHPNVLTVYEVGTVGERDYIAMELVEGTSLDKWLAARPPQEEVWSAILAAGRGLAAAHEAGVVHRDFKPHNVLRSRDGRILVTDFGLARGMLGESSDAAIDADTPLPETSATPELDETLEAPSRPSVTPKSHSGASRDSDSVLDAPLTQTGAVIGTPAYMAPEQFRGTAADPRTDQFAFCVTAWQALTGERPFKGSSIPELEEAVNAGVANIPAKLPRDVRAVLTRGLDPKPDARYPSLEALLEELDHAARRPQRRRRTALVVGLLAIAIVATVMARRGSTPATGAVCAPPEDVIAEAWSPAMRSALSRTPGVSPDAFARVAGALDQFRERWIASYQKACGMRSAKSSPARIACLEAVRDEASTLTFMLKSAPPQVFEAFDVHGMLPYIGRCERAEPDTPPPFPRQQPQRSQVVGLLARSMALRGVPPAQLDSALASLEQEATAIGWKPMLGALLTTAGGQYLAIGRVDRARELYARALTIVKETHDRRLEAVIRVNQLEAEMRQLAVPGAPVPRGATDPRAQATLHPALANAFSIARSTTHDDPMLVGSVEIIAAQAYGSLAQFNRYKDAYTDALGYAQTARKQFEEVGDIRRAAHCGVLEASIYLERSDERALDDALFAARRSADALAQAGLAPLPELDVVRIHVAFARRDYDEVHRLSDKYMSPRARTTSTITGHVKPAGRVSVIAWKGKLVGDPRRAYKDASGVQMDVVESAEDGRFTIHAEPGWAILAEAPDQRSAPQLVGTSPPVLALAPTTTVSGTARGKNLLGIAAFARFGIGDQVWQLEVPIDRDGTFDLRGLPAGSPRFGATGSAGDGTRRIYAPSPREVTWPSGQNLDVIVRGKDVGEEGSVWVFAGKATPGATRAQVEASLPTAANIALADVQPVGASNTDTGRELYQPGDWHAVVTDNASGETTVCAAGRREPDAPVACRVITVSPTVSIDYPDGRFAAGVTPIVLEP